MGSQWDRDQQKCSWQFKERSFKIWGLNKSTEYWRITIKPDSCKNVISRTNLLLETSEEVCMSSTRKIRCLQLLQMLQLAAVMGCFCLMGDRTPRLTWNASAPVPGTALLWEESSQQVFLTRSHSDPAFTPPCSADTHRNHYLWAWSYPLQGKKQVRSVNGLPKIQNNFKMQ